MKAKRWLIAILAIALVATMVCAVACDNHVHNYSEWGKNETQHWKYCPDDNEEEAGSRANHVYGDDGKCECGAEDPTDYTPFVSDKFYGAIGDMTMDGEDVTMSALIFTEEGEVFVNVMSEDGYCQGEYDYTVSDGVITVTMDDDSTVTGTIVANVISITLPLELTGADEQTVSKDIDFVGEMYLATINMYGDTMEMYVAKDTPLALLIELMDIDEEMTIKVDGQVVPANQYLSTKMPGKAITVDIIEPHYCDDVCDVCHKCLTDCTDPACEDKCLGHTHMVSYDLGEHAAAGSQAPEEKEYTYQDNVTVGANPTPAEGWVFKGWSDGEGTYYYGDSYTMPDHPVTFTAIYVRIINADSIKGVWQSDAKITAYIADPVGDGNAAVAVIINGTFFGLPYNSDHTELRYGENSIKYAENDKLDIDGITYTYVGPLTNASNTDFVGKWVEKDGTITLAVTTSSIDFSYDWYYAKAHVIIGEYLVLFNGNDDVYMLAKSDDTLEGYHYLDGNSTEVTFVVDTTVRITLADIVGVYTSGDHTAYISTNSYNKDSFVGSIILDGACHPLVANEDGTWSYNWSNDDYYSLVITYVSGGTLSIKQQKKVGEVMSELTYTWSDDVEDLELSAFEGAWRYTSGSTEYTLTVNPVKDSDKVTMRSGNGNNNSVQYCVIGDYLVVYFSNVYALAKEGSDTDPVIKGYRIYGSGPDAVQFASICDWEDYIGVYDRFAQGENNKTADLGTVWVVTVTKEGVELTIDDKPIKVTFYNYNKGSFTLDIELDVGVEVKEHGWTLGWDDDVHAFNLWCMAVPSGNPVDVYLLPHSDIDCEWVDWIGVYDEIYEDGSDDGYQYQKWIVTITAEGIEVSYNGQTYTATIVEFEANEFTLEIDLFDATWYLWEGDEDETINLWCNGGEVDIDVYLWKQLDEEVDWEDLIGTYEGEGTDTQDGEHTYKVVVTRRNVYIYIDDEMVEGVEFYDSGNDYIIIDSYSGYFGIYIQRDEDGKAVEIKFERYKNDALDDPEDGKIYLTTTLTASDAD